MNTFEWEDGMSVTASDMNDMQDIINGNIPTAISEALSWKFLGEKTGQDAIALPETFNELLCIVKINNSDNLNFPILVPVTYLSTTPQYFNSGYYATSTGSAYCRVAVSSTDAALQTAYINGVPGSGSKVYYYYR